MALIDEEAENEDNPMDEQAAIWNVLNVNQWGMEETNEQSLAIKVINWKNWMKENV